MNVLYPSPDNPLYHVGPLLEHGPLPAFFYFSLSGPDSLTLDPYNQPVQFLQGSMIRVFSMTLPGHEMGLSPANAMSLWADECAKGKHPLQEFLEKALSAVDYAIQEKFIDPNKMAVGGLSRGAFAAMHLAALEKRFTKLLCFAPLTRLSAIKEFKDLQENALAVSLDVHHLADMLEGRSARFFIGNHDSRVGTEHCTDFALKLAKKATRPPDIELHISKSIGQMGHGTSPEIFSLGAQWIQNSFK